MNRHKHSLIGVMLALLLSAPPLLAQSTEALPEPAAEADDAREASEAAEAMVKDSKSGYSDTVNSAGGGSKTVSAELVDGDRIFDAIFGRKLVGKLGSDYYRFKKSVNERTGIAFNVDYSVLASRASFSSTDDEDAASSVFRVYGAWLYDVSAYGTDIGLV